MTRKERDTYRQKTVEQYRESGMTRKAFCEAHDVALSTLDLWIRRYRNESANEDTATLPMVSIGTASPRSPERRVRFTAKSGVTVELDLPATEEEIATILRAVATV
jgi:transposase-like protein